MAQSSSINQRKMNQLRDSNPFISNTEIVFRLVRDDIVEHRFLPGQKINQEQIADELDMSRSPVREALALLEQEGFLSKGAQGYVVYTMQPGDYMALLDLRIAIEQLATRLACARISPAEGKQIAKNLQETDQLLEKGVGNAWDDDFTIVDKSLTDKLLHALGKYDQQFHSLIVGASHNRYLIEDYERLKPLIHFFRYSAMDISVCMNIKDRHRMIYEAILRRDEDAAVRYMTTHLSVTASRAMQY